jgi:hypothetical protein
MIFMDIVLGSMVLLCAVLLVWRRPGRGAARSRRRLNRLSDVVKRRNRQ